MARLTEFDVTWTEHASESLHRRRISELDVLDLFAGPHKVFIDERDENARYVIGPDCSGRLITIVIGLPNAENQNLRVITGWQSSSGEATVYSRPGGTDHV